MRIKELSQKLQNFNPETEVMFSDFSIRIKAWVNSALYKFFACIFGWNSGNDKATAQAINREFGSPEALNEVDAETLKRVHDVFQLYKACLPSENMMRYDVVEDGHRNRYDKRANDAIDTAINTIDSVLQPAADIEDVEADEENAHLNFQERVHQAKQIQGLCYTSDLDMIHDVYLQSNPQAYNPRAELAVYRSNPGKYRNELVQLKKKVLRAMIDQYFAEKEGRSALQKPSPKTESQIKSMMINPQLFIEAILN